MQVIAECSEYGDMFFLYVTHYHTPLSIWPNLLDTDYALPKSDKCLKAVSA